MKAFMQSGTLHHFNDSEERKNNYSVLIILSNFRLLRPQVRNLGGGTQDLGASADLSDWDRIIIRPTDSGLKELPMMKSYSTPQWHLAHHYSEDSSQENKIVGCCGTEPGPGILPSFSVNSVPSVVESVFPPPESSQLPFSAAGAGEQGVRFFVSREFVFLGVPLHFAAELVAVIGEAAKDAGVGAEGNICHRFLAAANAVDPIAAMARSDVGQTPIVGAER